jgi:hypothetical protein
MKKYFLENLPIGTPVLTKLIELTGGRNAAILAILDGQYQDTTITSKFSLGFF